LKPHLAAHQRIRRIKHHLKHKQTNKQTDKQTDRKRDTSICLFVCLFVRYVCQRRPSYGWTNRDASFKFKKGE